MKTLLEKTFLAMDKLFDFSQRARSRAKKRLDELKKHFCPELDHHALSSDYENIGKDLRAAMKRYERMSLQNPTKNQSCCR